MCLLVFVLVFWLCRNCKDGTRTAPWLQELCLAYQSAPGKDEQQQAESLPVDRSFSSSSSSAGAPKFLKESVKMAGYKKPSSGQASKAFSSPTPDKKKAALDMSCEDILALYGTAKKPRLSLPVSVIAVDSEEEPQDEGIVTEVLPDPEEVMPSQPQPKGKVYHDYANMKLVQLHPSGAIELAKFEGSKDGFRIAVFSDGSSHVTEFPALQVFR